MSMCRRFSGEPVARLIVSMPAELVEKVDRSIRGDHPARGCRSEFVRLAVAEKLERDLMLYASQKRGLADATVTRRKGTT